MYKGIRAGIKGMVRFHTRHILTLHLFDDFARNQHTACLAANAAHAGHTAVYEKIIFRGKVLLQKENTCGSRLIVLRVNLSRVSIENWPLTWRVRRTVSSSPASGWPQQRRPAHAVFRRVFHHGLPVCHALCYTFAHERCGPLSVWLSVVTPLQTMWPHPSTFLTPHCPRCFVLLQ